MHTSKTWKDKPGSCRSIDLTTSIWENLGDDLKRYGTAADGKYISLSQADA